MLLATRLSSFIKAILRENGYTKKRPNIDDFRKVNVSHRLSAYEVKVPYWNGKREIRKPFRPWARKGNHLKWYRAYNASKHDRHTSFESANFNNILDAICGLFALLSSQFGRHAFSPGSTLLAVSGGSDDGMESGIGGYLRVKFPTDWPKKMCYDFNWQDLKKKKGDPFRKINYSQISYV